jgi:hypothetical protein
LLIKLYVRKLQKKYLDKDISYIIISTGWYVYLPDGITSRCMHRIAGYDF